MVEGGRRAEGGGKDGGVGDGSTEGWRNKEGEVGGGARVWELRERERAERGSKRCWSLTAAHVVAAEHGLDTHCFAPASSILLLGRET